MENTDTRSQVQYGIQDMSKLNNSQLAAVVQNSAAGRDPRLQRQGLDAAGLTKEFDAKTEQYIKDAEKKFKDDPKTRKDFVSYITKSRMNARESLRKYEIRQVVEGANSESLATLDEQAKVFQNNSTLRMSQLAKEYDTNLNNERTVYESTINELKNKKDFYDRHKPADRQSEQDRQDETESGAAPSKQEGEPPAFDFNEKMRDAKRNYENRTTLAKAAYDAGMLGVVEQFENMGRMMHLSYYNSRKMLGDSDVVANARASQEVRKRAKGTIQAFISSGYTEIADVLINRYKDPDAVAMYLEQDKLDEKGNPVKDESGNAVREYALDKNGKRIVDMSRFNPGGRMWMGIDDVGELKKMLDSDLSERVRKAKAQASSMESEAKGEVNKAETVFMEIVRKLPPEQAESLMDDFMSGGEVASKHGVTGMYQMMGAAPEAVRQAQARMKSEVEAKKKIAESKKAVSTGAQHQYGGMSLEKAISTFDAHMARYNNPTVKSHGIVYRDANGKDGILNNIDRDFIIEAHCDAILQREDLTDDMRRRINGIRKDAVNKKLKNETRGFMKAINAIGFTRPKTYSSLNSKGETVPKDSGQTSRSVIIRANSDGSLSPIMDDNEKLKITIPSDEKNGTVTLDIGKEEAELLFADLFEAYKELPTNENTPEGIKARDRFVNIVKRELKKAHMKEKTKDEYTWVALSDEIGTMIMDSDELFGPTKVQKESELSKSITSFIFNPSGK